MLTKRRGALQAILGTTLLFAMLVVSFAPAYSAETESFHVDPELALPVFGTIDVPSMQGIIASPGLLNYAFAASGVEIAPVTTILDGGDFELGGPWEVAVYEDGSSTYAIVLARIGDAVQIIDITDPASPASVATLRDVDDLELDDPVDVAIYENGSSAYAIITAHNSNVVQIIDITDPASPVVTATLRDGGDFALYGPLGFTVYGDGSSTYAAVPAHFGDTIQIIDITDPASPVVVATLRDGGDFALDGPGVVAVYEDGSSTYAIVAVFDSDLVQIIDITDPASPVVVATLRDGGDFELGGPWGAAVYEGGSSTYAMIIARDDDAIQIIDITDPASPTSVAAIRDGGDFELDNPVDVAIYEDGSSTYAIATAINDDAIQIIDITDPASPTSVAAIRDGGDSELGGLTGVTVYEDGSSTYVIVLAFHGNAIKIMQIGTDTLPTDSVNALEGSTFQEKTERGIGEEVKKPDVGGCLIATAAYGTELAPQVQALREVRDYVVLDTALGSAFMQVFNQAYYSFSPTVADAERENQAFREMVKAAITPAVYALGIMSYADSEGSALMLGIVTILAITGIYVVVPLLAVSIVANKVRRNGSKRSRGLDTNSTLR